MKFIGSMFKNAMTTNHIEVKNGVVTIHNTENDYGFITMSVSYTHLDVYKRQVLNKRTAISLR